MSLSESYIGSLCDDPDRIEALTYLARHAKPYTPGVQVQPLKRRNTPDKPRQFVAITFGLTRPKEGMNARIRRCEWDTGGSLGTWSDDDSASIAASLSASVLTSSQSGRLIVTTGMRRSVLDAVLEHAGPGLVEMGYRLEPCITASRVGFIRIRKGHRQWTLTYMESLTGVPLDVSLEYARSAGMLFEESRYQAHSLYAAITAYAAFLFDTFGVALRPTIAMIALECARRFLPEDDWIWRPTPLLVAMERTGIGYRGGITYARKYTGPSVRIDVNRQYTAALREPMPMRVTFGKCLGFGDDHHGVFVCSLSGGGEVSYPFGIWCGPETGFRYEQRRRGEFVSVLHSSEFPGLRAAGWTIEAGYGYRYTGTFDLGSYVDTLQAVVDRAGKDSPEGLFCKPLGNMVYGKFGQRPERRQLLFSADNPGKKWYPYFDDSRKDWANIWERNATRYTSSQHVDIAATITGAARSQTTSLWCYLESLGFGVIRCHTDSLTLDDDPSDVMPTSDRLIGAWRIEQESQHTIVAGVNAYATEHSAHLAGVENVSYEDIERMHDDGAIGVTLDVNVPRSGWKRGTRKITREYRAV